MSLTSATTIALWFVEQVHLLRVYCTDTIPLTYGRLLKKKFKTTSENRKQLLSNKLWWQQTGEAGVLHFSVINSCWTKFASSSEQDYEYPSDFCINGAVLAYVM